MANSPPTLYTGPRVLVPIELCAMVITNLTQQTKTFSWVPPYQLPITRFQPGAPQPFATGIPTVGVTLHWVLPRALTHGVSDQRTGITAFPDAPNRWLITRFASDTTQTSGRSLTAWLVLSDYTGSDGTNSYATPDLQQLVPTLIGMQQDVTAWNGETQGYKLFLTAIGDGRASFTAYAPGIVNVFAFVDDLSNANLPNGRLTYSVTGWYSDPAQDYLADATTAQTWMKAMRDAGWDATQPPTPLYPPSIACHGAVYNVFWWGPNYLNLCTDDNQPIMGVPLTKQTISTGCPGQVATDAVIAVGNTPLDAFASLVEYQLQPSTYDARTLLEAFFYDELIDYGSSTGEVRLNEKIRSTWFGTQTGAVAGTSSTKRIPRPIQAKPHPRQN